MNKTKYDFATEIDELLDEAMNELSTEDYEKLLDDISQMLSEREY